jgi:putative DNA primase/helicase
MPPTAGLLFPDYVAVAPMNGAHAPDKTDWTTLQGRRTAIWSDSDEPGAAFASAVARLVTRGGTTSVCTVEVPADWPKGWDLADDLPDGVASKRLEELLDDAIDDAAVEMPSGFEMTPHGLFFTPDKIGKSQEPSPVFIAAPLRVVGETRSDHNEEWGVLLRWNDREGKPHQWSRPLRLVHGPGNEIAAELENNGLCCGSDSRAHELLKRFMGRVKTARLLRCVTRTGWHASETGLYSCSPAAKRLDAVRLTPSSKPTGPAQTRHIAPVGTLAANKGRGAGGRKRQAGAVSRGGVRRSAARRPKESHPGAYISLVRVEPARARPRWWRRASGGSQPPTRSFAPGAAPPTAWRVSQPRPQGNRL